MHSLTKLLSIAFISLLMTLVSSPKTEACTAQSFSCKNNRSARVSDRYCMACNLYHEGGSSSKYSREAVKGTGYSVFNRAINGFGGPRTLCGQVWADGQYSWTKMDKHDKIAAKDYCKMLALADELIDELKDKEKLKKAVEKEQNGAVCSTHYHTEATDVGGMGKYPCWSYYAHQKVRKGYNPNCKQGMRDQATKNMIPLKRLAGDPHLFMRKKGMKCITDDHGIDVSQLMSPAEAAQPASNASYSQSGFSTPVHYKAPKNSGSNPFSIMFLYLMMDPSFSGGSPYTPGAF